mmetsp:Transcript_22899/g.37681  ORF Transcript_22899/g.37681 Transcript_22899/m.37681 type:complete len:523 (+) Transcript_22899:122-1690(+)|eukprot:CAMPEP_0184657782 /NCGR_PEP_ID=MMETSP0308-20130426/21770_1 /TAXON_ID=38269 /ORGANISM="Gloeochaete witrockiana, Strain SAG 46.84" /LENGTH=522 /DNA_ID=CAMNT_0027096049 /DNA_START=49 /DNA_END=1617 /DNA_ORIENTATION=-
MTTPLEDQVALLQQQLAQLQSDKETDLQNVNNAITGTWVLLCAFIIFTMQTGFALLEAGAVRSKNSRNVILKACFDACAGALAWWATGYAFAGPFYADHAYVQSTNGFIGNTFFFTSRQFGNWANWFFQFTFAATASTIINGAMSERTRMGAYLIYTSMSTGFIYPVVAHWVWSSAGWLSNYGGGAFGTPLANGLLDFAGAGVVHMTGGFVALVGAIMVGPRTGRFDRDGKAVVIPGHNSLLQGAGALLLWFGFYAFNCGSTLATLDGWIGVGAMIAVNTTISAAAGGLTAMFIHLAIYDVYDLTALTNGFLAGCVAITSGCAYVEPWSAFIYGVVAAMMLTAGSHVLPLLKIDDPIDAFSVHGLGGMTGLFLTGWFATFESVRFNIYGNNSDPWTWGFVYGGGGSQFGVQLLGIVSIGGWAITMGLIVFSFIKYMPGLGLRVPIEVEMEGIDMSVHGGSAYPEMHMLMNAGGLPDASKYDPTPSVNRSVFIGANENGTDKFVPTEMVVKPDSSVPSTNNQV